MSSACIIDDLTTQTAMHGSSMLVVSFVISVVPFVDWSFTLARCCSVARSISRLVQLASYELFH